MNNIETIEDLGDELCEYCPLEKKGVYSVPGGSVAGCEGSHCAIAYDIYLESIEEYEMNNIEKNALRIADLINPNRALRTFWRDADIYKFSSYNGLMPFVFECNQNDHISFTMTSTCVHVTEINTSKPMRDRLNDFPIGDTEPEFIQAIQLAVIKYLELKNE